MTNVAIYNVYLFIKVKKRCNSKGITSMKPYIIWEYEQFVDADAEMASIKNWANNF